MPPRRTKARAAGEDDRCPTLKLIMEKGPLSGQTIEFPPRSVVRIGRYVRGNNLTIKDDGVSSKHLQIQCEAAADSGQRRWMVTDLGSSNGTFLNGEKLDSPAVLSSGDIIKIGEQTSILAEIEGIQQVNGTGLKDLDTEEKKDLGVNRVKKLPGVSTRRTRSSRKDGDAIEAAIDVSVIEGRKPRGRKKKVVETIPEETEKEEEKVAGELNSGEKDGAVELGSTSGVKENNVVNTLKGKMVVDLETMTMGEWFDFLEVYLPQQIIEESEAKIAEMRQTAERFHEYMVQQRKLKL